MPYRLRHFHRPADQRQAVELLQSADRTVPLLLAPRPAVDPYAEAEGVIDLSRLELDHIQHAEGRLHFGATCTLQALIDSALTGSQQLSALVEGARLACQPGLRRIATLGGLVHKRSGAIELWLALLALEALVVVETSAGRQSRSLLEPLAPSDLVLEVNVPLPVAGFGLGLARVARAPKAPPILAAVAHVTAAAGRCQTARIAVAGLHEQPGRVGAAEQLLAGQQLTLDAIEAAATAATESATLSDYLGGVEYRRAAGAVVVRRALHAAVWQATGANRAL